MDKSAIAEIQKSIESLANGINPFTGEIAKDDDALNDVKVSRCLFAASDVLKEILGAKHAFGVRKHSFIYDEEKNAKIVISHHPINLYQLIGNILYVYGRENKLTYYVLVPILLEKGVIIENPEGRPKVIGSEKGKEFGIVNVRKKSRYGERWQMLFDEKGQRYVISLLKEL